MADAQKSIFITGAGSGIGRATAQLFAERGWFVGLFDVNQQGLEETAAMLPEGQRISMVFDVRDRSGWARAVESFGQVTDRRMHVLFNNAGVARGGWFEDVPQDETDLLLDVNIKGVFNGVYAALPLLRETPGARIINTSSVAGISGLPKAAAYTASKFAVRGLTEALNAEFHRFGVRVVALMPFFIETPLLDAPTQNSNMPMRDALKSNSVPIYPVSECAQGVWDAAHGSDIYVMVGKEARRIRFATRFFPNAVRKELLKMVRDE